MELTHLPIIDWELGTKLAGNNRAAASDLLSFFIKNLRNDLNVIKEYYQREDLKALRNQIHKLHGAVCYCGLPRLKSTLSQLETNLKNNIMVSLPSLMDQLESEVSELLEHPSLPT